MIGKSCLNELDHLPRDRVGFEADPRRHIARALCAESLAVVGIEVPLATERLISGPLARAAWTVLHQDSMALALLAVEVLHAQRLSAPCVRRKIFHAGEEMPVLPDLKGQGVV